MLYSGLQKPVLFRVYFGYNVLVTIFINLAYGFSKSGIDNFAHIGGLIGGFLATGIVGSSDKTKWYLNRFLYLTITIAIVVSSLLYGFNNKQSQIIFKVKNMESLDKSQKWSEVKKVANEVLELNPKEVRSRISVYWSLARAEALTGNYDKGVEYSKKLIEIDPQDGHYILGLMYFDMKEYQSSKDELLEAKRLNAGFTNIDEILVEIDKHQK